VILDIERVGHGGVCIGHAEDGRVVFVRHALPGEQVRVDVTEERRAYLRADAVEVLRASPHRVEPPCPWARPGRCGGCDWQHVELAEQRRLKAAVVREQLQRLARVDREVVVEPVPGDETGLDWRTRLRFGTDRRGRAGFRKHRSHALELVGDCLIAAPGADVPELVARTWPREVEVSVDVTATGQRAVAVGTPDETVTERAAGREWAVPVGGFWQVHAGAADLLASVVAELATVQPGERCLDLYAGVGLFAAGLAAAGGQVTAVEADPRAVAAARTNLADLDVDVVRARVDRWDGLGAPADVVVLDPPRRGAGADVTRAVAATGARTVVYVACDPAALARDTATLLSSGYSLGELRAFDLFPMTAHVECVAAFTLTPTTQGCRL
jgi:tRNA/tmRNA/rRNA uracil-C5-methylase (TrmA/RlmC/RlmD family)